MPPERLIGLVVLLISVFLCLAVSLALDAQWFEPHNATLGATQTWQSQHNTRTPERRPRSTGTPKPGDFSNQASAPYQELSVFPSLAKLVRFPEIDL
jgi:hypothetical protein